MPSNPNLSTRDHLRHQPDVQRRRAPASAASPPPTAARTRPARRTPAARPASAASPTPPPAPLLPPSQTAGDCKRSSATDRASRTTVNDDTDKPVDGNACTQDLCNAGHRRRTRPRPRAPTCSQSSGTRCNGSGTAPACVQCLQPTDCPGTDTECHHRTCSAAGVCGISNTRGRNAGPAARRRATARRTSAWAARRWSVNDDTDLPGRRQRLHERPVHERRAVEPAAGRQRRLQRERRHPLQRQRAAPACVQCTAGQPVRHRHRLPDVHLQRRRPVRHQQRRATARPGRQPDGGRLQEERLQRHRRRSSPRPTTPTSPSTATTAPSTSATTASPSNPPLRRRRSLQPEQRHDVQRQRDGARLRPVPGQRPTAAPTPRARRSRCSAPACAARTNTADGTLVTNAPAGNCHKDVCMARRHHHRRRRHRRAGRRQPVHHRRLHERRRRRTRNVAAGVTCGAQPDVRRQRRLRRLPHRRRLPDAAQRAARAASADRRRLRLHQRRRGHAGDDTSRGRLPPATSATATATSCTVVDDNDKPSTNGNQCMQTRLHGGVAGARRRSTAGTACTQNTARVRRRRRVRRVHQRQRVPRRPDDRLPHAHLHERRVRHRSSATPARRRPTQMSGDCKMNVCDGAGNAVDMTDNGDLPTATNQCVTPTVRGGVPSTPTPRRTARPARRTSGRTCDGDGGLRPDVHVRADRRRHRRARRSVATAVFVEERSRSTGSSVRTIALPLHRMTGVSPKRSPCRASPTSEGALSLSGDGHYVIARRLQRARPAPPASPASATGVPRSSRASTPASTRPGPSTRPRTFGDDGLQRQQRPRRRHRTTGGRSG